MDAVLCYGCHARESSKDGLLRQALNRAQSPLGVEVLVLLIDVAVYEDHGHKDGGEQDFALPDDLRGGVRLICSLHVGVQELSGERFKLRARTPRGL